MIEKDISEIIKGQDKLDLYCAIIDALSKQIPRNPNIHGFDPSKLISSVSFTCPTCNKHIGRDAFCKHCGQKLGWEG